MKCPVCGQTEDKVLDSRVTGSGTAVRRRRECLSCHTRFTTREEIEKPELKVSKRDGSYQPFNMEKVKRGVWRALEKRALTSERYERLWQEIEEDIFTVERERKEVSTDIIGSIVLTRLKEYDQIAYLRFASVYKRFDNIEQLLQEIQCMNAVPAKEDAIITEGQDR